MTSLVGKTIGKYKLLDVLGSGGMAQVYRAIQMPLEREVAVKVLHTHLAEQDDLRERFLREAKAVAALRHPNIVHMYDYDYEVNLCYMAMEFLDDMSLEDRLWPSKPEINHPEPLAIAEALQIVVQIGQALDFAHKQGIVHRDVKPANIMQNSDGRVVLTDFGIATVLHETRYTLEGSTSGTPSYMSPEQALGERGDARSDIYSLGAVLYQLVTGRLPFEADTLYRLIMMHVNELPPPATLVNPQLDLAIEQIILKAMAKAPADRYQNAGDLVADAQAVLDGQPISIKIDYANKLTPIFLKYKVHIALISAILLLGLAIFFVFRSGPNLTQPDQDGVGSMAAQPEQGVDSMAAKPPLDRAYSETFEDNHANWLMTAKPISRQLVNGAYEIIIEVPSRAITTYPKMLGDYSKFSYSVETRLLNGQPESGYGLVFHRQDDQNYYVFAINGLKQWSIWRLEQGVWHELRDLPAAESWTTSEAIFPLGEVNYLQLEVNEATINLLINDKHLLKLADDNAPLTRGGIGFYAASSRTANPALTHIEFDNITLLPLENLTIPSKTSE